MVEDGPGGRLSHEVDCRRRGHGSGINRPSMRRLPKKLRRASLLRKPALTPKQRSQTFTFTPRNNVAEKTIREAIIEAMAEEMRRDPK